MSPTSLLLLRSEQPLLFTSRATTTPAAAAATTTTAITHTSNNTQAMKVVHEDVAALTALDNNNTRKAVTTTMDLASTPPPDAPPRLVHTRSAPSSLEANAHAAAAALTDGNRDGSAGTGHEPLECERNEENEVEYPEETTTTTTKTRDAERRSESFSIETSSSSTTFPPPTSRSESMSSLTNPFAKDNNLRIFFPKDDLAMKAILSPPHIRASSSTGKLAAETNGKAASAGASTAVANGGKSAITTLETASTNIFEQGAKLLFRGVSAGVTGVTVAAGGGGGGGGGSGATKHSSGSIVEEDLAKLNNNVLVSHPALPPPPFANMFACDNCREDIGTLLSKGRHHCRNCGGSFCADCSSKNIVVPFQVYLTRGEQRVCDGCYHRIKDFQTQAQSTKVTWSGHQPPENDVFTQDFDLPESEIPVTIFNCSLFMDFSPFYGHMFLTREHLCFKGYKGHKIKIPFAKIVSLIKPQFYYINALQVKTRRKEKFFFAEFNGLRDLCFLRMDQLIRAYQEGKKQFVQVRADDLVQQAMVRRKSYKLLVEQVSSGPKSSSFLSPPNKHDMDNFMSGKSTVGYIDIDEESDEEEEDHGSRCSVLDDDEEGSDKRSSASDEEVFEPLPPDGPLSKATVLLDCDLRADVKDVFDLLWNDGVGQGFLYGTMEKARDIDIRVDKWQGMNQSDEAEVNKGFVISKENDFTLHRVVTSQHPPKITFPGLPPYATCNRVQRFRLDKSSQGGERWDRFIISDILRMSKIPFSDYFEIETRWVFSRDGKNYCHVQAGLIVNFLKSTWFKSQINSSTMSESKEVLESWAKQAIEHLKAHEGSPTRSRSVPQATSSPLDNPADGNADAVVTEDKRPVSKSPRALQVESPTSRRRSTAEQQSSVATDAFSLRFRQVVDAGSSLYLQWFILLVLLYCWMLIRTQQSQIQRLTATTDALLAKLQQQGGFLASADTASPSAIQDACQQRIVEGASHALRQFFENMHAQ